MLKSAQSAGPSARITAELAYHAERQFGPQWRALLCALAAELFGNFSEAEAQGFFRQLGGRLARDLALPTADTLEALQDVINARFAELDWGLATLQVADGAIAIRHDGYPGQRSPEPASGDWRRAFAAVLEGLYTGWLQVQGGQAEMTARLRSPAGPEGLEFAYGL